MKARLVTIAFVLAAGCSVEKMPPIKMVHRGIDMTPKRVVVLPTECVAAQIVAATTDPTAWCRSVDQMVAAELAFRGIEVVDLSKLPAYQRTREEIEVTTIVNGKSSDHQRVTVVGPTYSDVDMWTQRRALADLGISALVRVRTAHITTWPLRAIAMVRLIRPEDAALIDATMCQLEVSRMDGDVEVIERAVRCALKGIAP
jgi:hypothetical protein